MVRVKKVIRVPRGTTPKMMKVFGVSQFCILDALAFRSNSELAERIRDKAIKEYGGIYTKGF